MYIIYIYIYMLIYWKSILEYLELREIRITWLIWYIGLSIFKVYRNNVFLKNNYREIEYIV